MRQACDGAEKAAAHVTATIIQRKWKRSDPEYRIRIQPIIIVLSGE